MDELLNPTFPEQAGCYVLIEGQYAIDIRASGPNLILVVGYTRGPGLTFSHPNLLTHEHEFWFKHDSGGSKSWTSANGIEHTFIIPRSKIQLVREKGYSYPKIVIGGMTVTLNVSGGSGARFPGWVDFIGETASTLVNLPMEVLRAIAEASIHPNESAKLVAVRLAEVQETVK